MMMMMVVVLWPCGGESLHGRFSTWLTLASLAWMKGIPCVGLKRYYCAIFTLMCKHVHIKTSNPTLWRRRAPIGVFLMILQRHFMVSASIYSTQAPKKKKCLIEVYIILDLTAPTSHRTGSWGFQRAQWQGKPPHGAPPRGSTIYSFSLWS